MHTYRFRPSMESKISSVAGLDLERRSKLVGNKKKYGKLPRMVKVEIFDLRSKKIIQVLHIFVNNNKNCEKISFDDFGALKLFGVTYQGGFCKKCKFNTKPPSVAPSMMPSNQPTMMPSDEPTMMPSDEPTMMPSNKHSPPMPTIFPTPNPPTYDLVIDKECSSCYIALREVIFYSDAGGTIPLIPSTAGVVSLTATETSKLDLGNGVDFSASKCIDGSVGDRCASDGEICHSDLEANPAFTFTLKSFVPPASFRIYYRRCTNEFPPTRATLTGEGLDYTTGLSDSVDDELYVIEWDLF